MKPLTTLALARRKITGWRMLGYIAYVVVIAMWVGPLIWLVSSSLKPEADIVTYPVRWIPQEITWEHYIRVVERFPLPFWYRNSMIVAAATVAIVVGVDVLCAYALARMNFFGRNFLLLLFISTFLLPAEVTFIPLFMALAKLGVAKSLWSLILPPSASAFGVFLLTQFFKTIPTELEEAAAIDGCGRLRILFKVILPLSKPALAAVTLFTFLASWNNYMWPLIVSTGDENVTLPVGLANLYGSGLLSQYYGIVFAASVYATLPVLIVFLALQRFFVQGIALSGIKG